MALTKPKSNQVEHPDARKHKVISFAKSGMRMVGFACLVLGNLPAAGLILIIAEVAGIVEEMV